MKYLVLLFVFCMPAFSTTYFVDNCVIVGSDSNGGTASGTPWLTVAKVNSTVGAGDTVNFERGCIWREQFTFSAANVTLQAYGSGNKPSFRGSNTFNVAGNWTNKSGNLWYVSGIAQDPGAVVHGDTAQCTGTGCSGLIGQRKTSEGALGAQWDSWYDSGNTRMQIYSVGNPTTLSSMLEVAVRTNGDTQGCQSGTFTNLDFRGWAQVVLFQFGCATTVTITNCDFAFMGTNGVQFNDNSSTGMRATVTGSTFTDWGFTSTGELFAMQAIGGAGPMIWSNNTCTSNNNFNTIALACVVSDVNSWSPVIAGNTFNNAGGSTQPGIVGFGHYDVTAGIGANVIQMVGNVCYNVGMCMDVNGLSNLAATPEVWISYNYSQNCNVADVLDTHCIRVYVTNSTVPVKILYNVVNGCAAGANIHAGIASDTASGYQVWGNTVVGCDDGILFKNNSLQANTENNISAFNRRYGINVDGTSSISIFTRDLFFSNATANYNGIAPGTGDVTTDPLFVNRAGNNLTLQATSPAINSAGTVLSSRYKIGLSASTPLPPFKYYDQTLAGSGWDIGAFVFSQGTLGDAYLQGKATLGGKLTLQ